MTKANNLDSGIGSSNAQVDQKNEGDNLIAEMFGP